MKVGRNHPCPCGSGKKYKKCCSRKNEGRRSGSRTGEYMGVYAEFANLFPGEESSRQHLINDINSFDLDDYLQITSKVNYILSHHYGFNDGTELIVLKDLLNNERYLKAEQLVKSNQVARMIIRHQMIGVMMDNLLLTENKSNRTVNEYKHDYGKSIFRMNDLLENDLWTNKAEQQNTSKEKTLGSLFRNMFLNDTFDFKNLIGRYYSIFFQYLPKLQKDKKYRGQSIDAVALFEESTGVELKLYMVLAMLIWGHYEKGSVKDKLKFLNKPGSYILNTQLPVFKDSMKESARIAFQNFSNDRMGFSEALKKSLIDGGQKLNYYKTTPFLKTPLYRLPNGNYFPIDMGYFQQKITSGLKWDIHDYLLEKEKSSSNESEKKEYKKQRNLLFTFYGHLLEGYTTDLLKRVFKLQKNCLLLNKPDDTGGVDFIIYDYKNPENIFFIELTASWMHREVVMQGDIDKILDQFKSLFVGRDVTDKNKEFSAKTSKEKIRQISDSIQAFKDGKLRKLNTIKDNVRNIYPILLTETGFPQFPGLFERYLEIISNANLLEGCLHNFQFIDIEELEIIEEAFGKNSKDRVSKLIIDRVQSEICRYPFKNYLSRKDLIRVSNRMFKLSHGIFKDSNRYLKLNIYLKIRNVFTYYKTKIELFLSNL